MLAIAVSAQKQGLKAVCVYATLWMQQMEALERKMEMAILIIAVVLIAVVVTRSKYKNRSNAGAFFFENGSLVLNSGIPDPIPFDEIDRVELHFNSWELEHRFSYGLFVKVIKKDGKSKRVFYKGYGTAELAKPSDMEAALRERGICCVLVDE